MNQNHKNQKKRTPITGLGLVFGAGIGLMIGTVFGQSGIGLVYGAGVGLVIGAVLDVRNKKRAG